VKGIPGQAGTSASAQKLGRVFEYGRGIGPWDRSLSPKTEDPRILSARTGNVLGQKRGSTGSKGQREIVNYYYCNSAKKDAQGGIDIRFNQKKTNVGAKQANLTTYPEEKSWPVEKNLNKSHREYSGSKESSGVVPQLKVGSVKKAYLLDDRGGGGLSSKDGPVEVSILTTEMKEDSKLSTRNQPAINNGVQNNSVIHEEKSSSDVLGENTVPSIPVQFGDAIIGADSQSSNPTNPPNARQPSPQTRPTTLGYRTSSALRHPPKPPAPTPKVCMFSEFSGMLASAVTKTMLHQRNPYALLLAQNIDPQHFIPPTQEKFSKPQIHAASKTYLNATTDSLHHPSRPPSAFGQKSLTHKVKSGRSISVKKFNRGDSRPIGADKGLQQGLAASGVGLRHGRIKARESEGLEGNVKDLNNSVEMIDQIGKFEHMVRVRNGSDRRKISGYPAIKFDMFKKQIADREEFMATAGSVKEEQVGKGKVQRENLGIVNGIKTEKENVVVVEKKQGNLLAKTNKQFLHL
jgi:hypothetical protein